MSRIKHSDTCYNGEISFSNYGMLTLYSFLSALLFMNRYYYDIDLIPLLVLIIFFSVVFITGVPLLLPVFFFLPFNTSVAVFGKSVMTYCLIMAGFGFFVRLITSKSNLSFRLTPGSLMLVFFLFMSIKDIVVYQGINSFTYVVSLLILRAIVFKFGQENSEYDRYFAFGMALVVFGLLQLMTLNVTSRWVGMGRIVTQLPGTYEPNYYAFYLMIFVVFLLYTEKRKLNVLVLLISIALIIATRSNTGIIALLIIVVFRSRMEFGRKITLKTLTVIISILLVLIVICMVLWVGIMKLIFDSRIGVTLSNFLQSRDLNRLLSGRVLIWEAHLRAIFERDLPELLFGEAYQGGVYVEELGEEMTSHNFFIDLLNQNGMFGLLFFIVYIFFLLRSSIRLVISSRERSMVFSYLMVVLLFSLTLRLFSERAMWAILFSVESRIFNLGTKEVHDDRY